MTYLRLIILCLYGCVTLSLHALTLTKEERKEFKKISEIGCTIDFSQATIDGMPYSSFIPYYAESIGKSDQYVRTFFESLPDIIMTYPKDLLKRDLRVKVDSYKPLENRTYFSKSRHEYNIIITINSLSLKGAIDANVKFYKDNPNDYYEFQVTEKEGKWNDDFRLIKEQMASLGANLAFKIHGWGRNVFPKELKSK